MWEYRPSPQAATDLCALFRDVLSACRLQDTETVLVYCDAQSPPHYAAAFVTAAQDLGAVSFALTVPSNADPVETGVILEAFKGADLVVDLASYGTTIYRPLRTEALKAGTRILRVSEPEDVLFRMRPDQVVRERAKRSEALVEAASTFHITSPGGTDIVVDKTGRQAFGLWGIPEEPGSWDHWPMGLVVVGANREGTNGTIVIEPGDILLSMQHYVSSRITVTVNEGVITAIDGTRDAAMLRQWFAQWHDERVYHISHVGWGCDHRALWDRLGRKAHGGTDDTESYYGVMQIAFGRDTSFLAGTNDVPGHMDFDCLGNNIALDDEPVIEAGEFLSDELRHDAAAAVAG